MHGKYEKWVQEGSARHRKWNIIKMDLGEIKFEVWIVFIWLRMGW
jgi:hypothetical protein